MRVFGTFFASLFEPQGKRFGAPWDVVVARFAVAPTFQNKTEPARFAMALFENDRRSNANVLSVSAVVLDFDKHTEEQRLRAAYGDRLGFGHTTFSATTAHQRWRVMLPLSRPVSRGDHTRVWRFAAGAAERAGLLPDYAAADAARIWSVPAIPAGGTYFVTRFDGVPLDVDEALLAIPRDEPRTFATPPQMSDDLARRSDRARRWLECVDGAISGAGGHAQTFKAALGLVQGFMLPEDVALELLATAFNPRCDPPWKEWELRHKVKQAAQRARVEPGYLANAPRRAS